MFPRKKPVQHRPMPQPMQRQQPKEKKRKCKIVIRKKGDRIEKSIEGECSASEIKALSEQHNLNEE